MKLCDYDVAKKFKFIAVSLVFIGCIGFIQEQKQLVIGKVTVCTSVVVIAGPCRHDIGLSNRGGRW